MKCDRCGADVAETLLLCPSCGNILHKEEKKEEKPSSPNPFCSTGDSKVEKKDITPYIPQPTIVDKRAKDLFLSVQYHLGNFIYILIITVLAVALHKTASLMWLYKVIGYGGLIALAYIDGILIGNIFFSLLFAPFFYKCDIPFWVSYIPGINVLTYHLNALQGEGRPIKNAILAFIGSFIFSKAGNVSFLNQPPISIVIGILDLVLLIFFAAEVLYLGIRVAVNYSDRFGYKNIFAKIGFVFFPIIMILVVIFSKERKYQY